MPNFKGFLHRILEKTAAAKWKHALNTLSDATYNRLYNEGMIIDSARELAGLNRGTDNIIRRAGFTKQRITDQNDINALVDGVGGFATIRGFLHTPENHLYASVEPYKNVVAYVPSRVKKSPMMGDLKKVPKSISGRQPTETDWVDAIALRHEALEASAYNKLRRKHDNSYIKYHINPNAKWKTMDLGYLPYKAHTKDTIDGPFKALPGVPVGNHNSPSVLANETRFLGLLQNRGAGDIIRQARRGTGESRLLAQKAGLNPSDDVYKLPITKKLNKRLLSTKGVERTDTAIIHDNSPTLNGSLVPVNEVKLRGLLERIPD